MKPQGSATKKKCPVGGILSLQGSRRAWSCLQWMESQWSRLGSQHWKLRHARWMVFPPGGVVGSLEGESSHCPSIPHFGSFSPILASKPEQPLICLWYLLENLQYVIVCLPVFTWFLFIDNRAYTKWKLSGTSEPDSWLHFTPIRRFWTQSDLHLYMSSVFLLSWVLIFHTLILEISSGCQVRSLTSPIKKFINLPHLWLNKYFSWRWNLGGSGLALGFQPCCPFVSTVKDTLSRCESAASRNIHTHTFSPTLWNK